MFIIINDKIFFHIFIFILNLFFFSFQLLNFFTDMMTHIPADGSTGKYK